MEHILTPRRIARFWEVLDRRQPNLTVVLENVHDMHNIAATMRTCDAVGIREIYIIHNPDVHYCKLSTTVGKYSSSSANKWLKAHYFHDTAECLAAVRQKYDRIYTTHLSEDAVSVYQLDLTESVALVFGNERDGLTDAAIQASDGNFHIPQVGMIKSLNISVACAISLYEAFRQRQSKGCYDEISLDKTERQSTFDEWVARDLAKKSRNR